MSPLVFYFLSALTIISALVVVFARKPMYSVLSLIVCFFTIAGHYVLLNAQFLAITHIIVYAGAIMVLFLFVVCCICKHSFCLIIFISLRMVSSNYLTTANTEIFSRRALRNRAVSYTHLRAHETVLDLVCRLLLEKKKTSRRYTSNTLQP